MELVCEPLIEQTKTSVEFAILAQEMQEFRKSQSEIYKKTYDLFKLYGADFGEYIKTSTYWQQTSLFINSYIEAYKSNSTFDLKVISTWNLKLNSLLVEQQIEADKIEKLLEEAHPSSELNIYYSQEQPEIRELLDRAMKLFLELAKDEQPTSPLFKFGKKIEDLFKIQSNKTGSNRLLELTDKEGLFGLLEAFRNVVLENLLELGIGVNQLPKLLVFLGKIVLDDQIREKVFDKLSFNYPKFQDEINCQNYADFEGFAQEDFAVPKYPSYSKESQVANTLSVLKFMYSVFGITRISFLISELANIANSLNTDMYQVAKVSLDNIIYQNQGDVFKALIENTDIADLSTFKRFVASSGPRNYQKWKELSQIMETLKLLEHL
jgi:hypothetical protein